MGPCLVVASGSRLVDVGELTMLICEVKCKQRGLPQDKMISLTNDPRSSLRSWGHEYRKVYFSGVPSCRLPNSLAAVEIEHQISPIVKGRRSCGAVENPRQRYGPKRNNELEQSCSPWPERKKKRSANPLDSLDSFQHLSPRSK